MFTSKITCPSCAAHMNSGKPLPAGKVIKCIKCGSRFPIPVAQTNVPIPNSPNGDPRWAPSPKGIVADTKVAAKGRNGRPEPQISSEKKKGNRALRWGLVGSAAIVLVVGLGLGIILARVASVSPSPAAIETGASALKINEQWAQNDTAMGPVQGETKHPLKAEAAKKSANAQDTSKPKEDGSNTTAGASPKVATPAPDSSQQPGKEVGIPIPAEPALTQDFLNRLTAYAEWLLDIQLTESQRRECQQLWIKGWKGAEQSMKDGFLAHAEAELKWAGEVAKLTEPERTELRAQKQPFFLAGLRKSADPEDRMLLNLYESAHRPGGERNPILVPGTPSLAQDMVDRWRMFAEWILDLRLTEQQRQEFQGLFMKEWKKLDQAAKDKSFKGNTQGLPSQLSLLNGYYRDLVRAQGRPQFLARLEKSTSDGLSAWLLAAYKSAHQPGGERNPVHVPGQPSLTQDMVSAYGDFIEWLLALRLSGGLIEPQRDDLREVLISDWKKMDQSGKDNFLRLLKMWNTIAQLSDAERTKYLEKLQPKFLTHLRSAPDHEPSRWLLDIYDREQELIRAYTKDLQSRSPSQKKTSG